MNSTVNDRYVVAGSKPWNRRLFDQELCQLPGSWSFVGSQDELTPTLIDRIDPRYIFFLHWSWRVPAEIVHAYECVNFHMTDLPYGRGGSPLQNLILRGHTTTRLTAHRMTDGIDDGPVYLKSELPLSGTAQEILVRAGSKSREMIEEIIRNEPEPVAQQGPVVTFKRRSAEQSMIPPLESLDAMYDFIRMLDGDGYPHAYVEVGRFRFEFAGATRRENEVTAEVTITRGPEPDK